LGRLSQRRDEPVSTSVGGADEPLAASVVPDRLTCRLDPAGERRLAHEAIAPDGVEQLLFGHDPVPFPDQHGEEVEHLWLNRTAAPSPAQLEPVEIKFAVAEHEDQESSLPR
jgi:hypothetical protein